MTMHHFNLKHVDSSWHPIIEKALSEIDPLYLKALLKTDEWLPGPGKIFNAFSLPLNKTNYILLGESPYPRQESANGYAFWDAAITDIWSPTGLSKPVNRATSMRHLIKMLLVAEGLLDSDHTTQPDIVDVDKKSLIKTNDEFFNNLLRHGFLLLNATPVLQDGPPKKDALAWRPFIKTILEYAKKNNPSIKLILFGKIAQEINRLLPHDNGKNIVAEHPYNITFINNLDVQKFFRPFHLLKRYK